MAVFRGRILSALGSLALLLAASAAWAASDLENYLAERRASGMSEGAEQAIASVAALISGSSNLVLEREPDGSYGRTYTNAACLRPGSDSPERLKLVADLKARTEAAFSRLKAVADFDHSGFVSTQEGWRLRQAIEFGLMAEQLAAADQASPAAVAKALAMTQDTARSAAADYQTLRSSLDSSTAAALPELPAGLLARSSNPSLQRARP